MRLLYAIAAIVTVATSTASAQTGNVGHDRMSSLSPAQQAKLLGMGVPCVGTEAFFQGMSPNNEAFWSVRCSNGKSYQTMLTPNLADSKVLECSVIEALGLTPCFKKFPNQVSRN